jgi:hypothetical protein
LEHVPEVVVLGQQLARPLNRRHQVTVELPEFAIRAIHWRVDEANADEEGERVTFNATFSTAEFFLSQRVWKGRRTSLLNRAKLHKTREAVTYDESVVVVGIRRNFGNADRTPGGAAGR